MWGNPRLLQSTKTRKRDGPSNWQGSSSSHSFDVIEALPVIAYAYVHVHEYVYDHVSVYVDVHVSVCVDVNVNVGVDDPTIREATLLSERH